VYGTKNLADGVESFSDAAENIGEIIKWSAIGGSIFCIVCSLCCAYCCYKCKQPKEDKKPKVDQLAD